MDYTTESGQVISIPDENLIRPIDLPKHIGEVLSFHNGQGYVVTGRLTEAEFDPDEFSFREPLSKLDYEDELNMSMLYEPGNTYAALMSFMYGYVLVVQNIHNDELMHDIFFIAKPTAEEIAFREKMLSQTKEWYEQNYNRVNEIAIAHGAEEDDFDPDEDMLSAEEISEIENMFNENGNAK